MKILVHDGLALTSAGLAVTDVMIDGGRIASIGSDITMVPDLEVDASGCLVGPGLVDIHAHLRDPGQRWKEDLSSGLRAAGAGGFTALVVMPNTEPAVDSAHAIEEITRRARSLSPIEVGVAGALTEGRSGLTAAPIEAMYEAGARLFTDDGDCVEDPEIAETLMARMARLPGAVFAQHAEESTLTRGGHMHEGEISASVDVGGMPSEAEWRIVSRDIELVERTGARYHCQHVSAAATIDLIRGAKERGLPITCEVTPHHLTYVDSDVQGLDPNFKMYPPLRSDADRAALRSALLDGTIDAVATDHAPHTLEEKSVSFAAAPRGVIGLETAAAAVWEAVEDPHRFFDVLSITPARIAGMEAQGRVLEVGAPGNIVVLDPNATWTPERFFSKSSNSPYLGVEMTGRVVATIANGELIHERGQVLT